ncbi:tetratricopeptide repeat protein [Rhizobium sp. Root1220]|uniref:tetratricopeptide repeat protein n=1 Tax=Rhizobium sp. Root1220 TaxID=1736432 RepID=UPI000AEBD762|nr:tetratricopeptide repeat protein [Rhizobium sp. Root1220]
MADGRFKATERQRAILRYLAERRFAGCEQGVKAYAVALDVLGRPSNFDPSTDPIVRIEMSRLRTSLDTFYTAFGKDGMPSIHLPKGSYVALFPKKHVAHDPADDPDEAAVEAGVPFAEGQTAAPPTTLPRRKMAWALAGLPILVLGTIVSPILFSSPVHTEKPVVALVFHAAQNELRGEASQTRDMLLAGLTEWQTLTITSEAKPGDYEVDLKYYGNDDARSVWWQVVDSGSRDILKSGLESIQTDGRSDAAIRDELASALALRLGGTRGVINEMELQKADEDAIGNVCVLRAENALGEGGTEGPAASMACLTRSLSEDPADSDVQALLARVIVAVPTEGREKQQGLARARSLAAAAASASPLSSRAQSAMMAVEFAEGRVEAAVRSGNRALKINPNDAAAAAALGAVLFSNGDFDAALALARNASSLGGAVPRDAIVVLALDAYRKQDWAQASLLAEQMDCKDAVVGALRAAALGQLGSDLAPGRLADVSRHDALSGKSIRQRLEARGLQPTIVTELEAGLAKARRVPTSSGDNPAVTLR